ncbi:pyruvate, phosphate dikinase [Paenibacillus mucilaginosus]|uniref:Pyruvate, phosphate dikinase n=1 Tax=Paenibacillus mucilaginosus (strain KNP414) TaxID=1036673 RepID=F8FJD0_PAEMK|nr:pyruvate, phosphate dikinase [Paenibacillus mucilaginosus]AEI39893.1 PpdK [Paenibacillus mucilaginosus KNP414]MCG7217213.1 pyruvate, phosphate dikinase [Paenibacillus mucilaginosus]WDM29169.1 pyruvate, phosphate dikinase [Paenibacillus mucilaginosus]
MRKQRVLFFTEGNAGMKTLLGGKGANLAEMTKAGLPVPPGFTVTTEVCRAYLAGGHQLPEGLMDEVAAAMTGIEELKGQGFGRPDAPLLVSVRSGSVTSMPGMMDTILNLGLNDETVAGLAAMTGNPRFAYDCYRRLLQMFGNVVFEIEHYHFERELLLLKKEQGCEEDSELSAERVEELCRAYQRVIKKKAGVSFPQGVFDQLHMAIEAVFRSWNNPRAVVYRKLNRIPDHQGTAVNIQSMVFGNLGEDSGTGVLFTRNPSTGEKVLYGEYLMNAQGEDVVAGIRTPQGIAGLAGEQPQLYLQIEEVAQKLERHYRDMQDIEFTIENGKLYILQTRSGKRTAQAAVKIAADLVEEGVISKAEALERIEVSHLDQLLHRSIDEGQPLNVLASGLPASPGAATGQAVFDADTAEEWARAGRQVLLVRAETTPEDIHGVLAATGVLTTRGGMTSHAAVVARGMGKPCVCGCEALRIGEGSFTIGGTQVNEGDWVSIDGATGRVILGKLVLKEPEISPELSTLLGWADGIRRLKVLTNADTPEDAAKARELGAEGIGLCRTEHMFMSADRVPVVQEMILAEDEAARRTALGKLLPMQQGDFEGIFRSMAGLPVTVRLLDPPLHEFLPSLEHLIVQQARLSCDASSDRAEKEKVDTLLRKVRGLHEMNPMLGTRGCRLGILFEEIYEMQVEALFRAALICRAEGIEVLPELMIPLVGHANELKRMRELVDRTAARVLGERLPEVPYRVGTMIEVPRAAITAGQIARHADFFSFGTNDLTQMTFGYSRDDAEGKFLTHYVEHKLLPENPFQVLDEEGVGELILWAVDKGRAVKPALKTGVCGEHGGDKDSIFFCHGAGLDYVSCSPYRVPLARIAAAQAVIAAEREAAAERETVQTA